MLRASRLSANISRQEMNNLPAAFEKTGTCKNRDRPPLIRWASEPPNKCLGPTARCRAVASLPARQRAAGHAERWTT